MSREVRDLETKRGLFPKGGGSSGARQSLLTYSMRNNSAAVARAPGAISKGRRIGRASAFLSRRMARQGKRADRGVFGNSRGPIQ